LPNSSLLEKDTIWAKLTPTTKSIWVPGVLTPTFVSEWLALTQKRNLELIIRDATMLFCPTISFKRFMRHHHFILVTRDIPIAAICYNPTSPKGYVFDEEAFCQALQLHTELPVFNIKKEDKHE
jgi:hypothetical protein